MFFQGKSLGLEIHQHGFVWTLASGHAETPVIERYEISADSGEFLKTSIKEPNIIDPDLLAKQIAGGWNMLATDIRRVSLSLPDLSGRIMMLEMDSPIKSKAEGIDQVKWKLKKSFPVELNELHLDYHLLKVDEDGNSSLLVALASKSVISEYEDLLLSISLEPVKIDFASLNLYRLFSSRLEVNDNLAFLICHRGLLTVMVFQDGILDFHRSKYIGTSLSDPVRLYREVNSSLLVYADSRGGCKPQKFFYHVSPPERELFKNVLFEATGMDPFLADTDAIVSASKQRIDRLELPEILSALGAASRSLR